MMTATYSPEDNKLRLYPDGRLPRDLYDRMRAAGFAWAAKQELFVAPAWTPERADLLSELCGEIGDEDTSLVDRAEERAERFEEYGEKRGAEAERAKAAVDHLADGIPLGQPILVGHHSEKRARKDAERIRDGMTRAVKLWETSKYWADRAAGAVRAAKYKERPDVRARRIKGLEADERKHQRDRAKAEAGLRLWTAKPLTHEQALAIAGRTEAGYLRLPPKKGDRPDWPHRPTAYDGLTGHHPTLYAPRTVDEVVAAAKEAYPALIAHYDRWLSHLANRLTYERGMLAETGGTVADRVKPEKGGAVRCWVARGAWLTVQKVNRVSVTVLDNWGNGGKDFTRTVEFDKLSGVMTAAQVAEARAAGRVQDVEGGRGFRLLDEPARVLTPKEENPKDTEFRALKETAKTGVSVVSAPQLFPTPPEIARRVVELAGIEPGHTVLEPSAGTGSLVRAVRESCDGADVTAVEVHPRLAAGLAGLLAGSGVMLRNADFLTLNGELGQFDRIVMNPPFADGADVRHVEHARTKLKPGGRLVSVVANGPRQRAGLGPIASEWIDLPAGSFKEQGTSVNVAIVVLDGLTRPDEG
jgi:hypothetical protein